jgi:putative two-component system response regulator
MGEAEQKFTVLAVDDSEDILDLIEHVLAADCLVKRASDGRTALRAAFEKPQPDLILLDVEMPGSGGYDVCRAIKATPAIADVPVIFLTQRADAQDVVRGFQMGAIDYFTKPVIPTVFAARVRAHVELIRRRQRQEEVILERSAQLEQARLQLIRRLGRAMEYHETSAVGNRVVRLAHYARLLAQAAGAKPAQCDLMMKAAPLHDIGKLGVPAHILRKTEKLSVPEREQMQRHPEIGAEIIGMHDDPLLGLARTLALTHHERWDGTGYPSRAAGTDIPWPGRVMAVVDAFEGMTATQFHRDPIPVDIAAQEIVRGAGKQFDPEIIEAFRKVLPAFRDVRETYADSLGDMLNLDFASAPRPAADPAVEERAVQAVREADEARARTLASLQNKLRFERELAAAASKDLSTQQAARKKAEEAYARDAEATELTKRRIAEETAAARAAQERAKAMEDRRATEEALAKSAAALADAQERALAAAKQRADAEAAARQAAEERLQAERRASDFLRQVKAENARAESAAQARTDAEKALAAAAEEKLRETQQIREALAKSEAEVKRLTREIEEAKARIQAEAQSRAAAEKSLGETSVKAAAEMARIAADAQELQAAKSRAQAEAEARAASEQKAAAAEQETRQAQEQLAKAQAELTRAAQARASAEEALAAASQEKQRTQDALARENAQQIEEAKKRLEAEAQARASTEQALAAAGREKQRTQEELDKAQAELARSAQEIEEAKKRLETEAQARAAAEAKVAAMREDVAAQTLAAAQARTDAEKPVKPPPAPVPARREGSRRHVAYAAALAAFALGAAAAWHLKEGETPPPPPPLAKPALPPQPIELFPDGAPLALRLDGDFERLAPRQR